MTFQIGEKVVYPNQGVGIIENISSRSFGSDLEKFYLLRLGSNSMTVMIPFSNVGNVGLRKIAKAQEINRILLFLATGTCDTTGDWKNRFKENTEKMQSGNLTQAAEVLKSLLILQAEKPLSFREKRMLERARHFLVAEISIVRKVPEVTAIALLKKALGRASLALPAPY
ncbi:MAG TPA: CarD family transcriptional regulator [Bryobacteraceae bacterium]|nr:CarD family transcriptional regulator [Bryobacteraceae bacterium]